MISHVANSSSCRREPLRETWLFRDSPTHVTMANADLISRAAGWSLEGRSRLNIHQFQGASAT